jgi:hypothetical protein
MARDTRVDRAVLDVLAPFFRFRAARLTFLAWLTLRLRPFRLWDLAVTALDRWTEGRAAPEEFRPGELQARRPE